MMVLEEYNFLGMRLQILFRQFDFGSFLMGSREKDYPCNICPSCYVLNNDDSYSRLSNDIDQTVRLFFPDILVLVLFSMLIDYLNGCARVRSINIAVQIKTIGEHLLVFSSLWFDIYFWLSLEKYKIV
jgi:hypothetical protein